MVQRQQSWVPTPQPWCLGERRDSSLCSAHSSSFLLFFCAGKTAFCCFSLSHPLFIFLLFVLTCLFLPFIQTCCWNASQATWNCEKWIHAVSHLSAQFLNKRKSKQKPFSKWKMWNKLITFLSYLFIFHAGSFSSLNSLSCISPFYL